MNAKKNSDGKCLVKKIAMLGIITSMFIFFLGNVFAQVAQPSGPDSLNVTSSTRHPDTTDPATVQAQAGNVSSMVIITTTTTKSWQGYYGNITGTITLDDANNQTFYDWSLPNPQGEIYASNFSTVTWTRVYCMNVSPIRPLCNTQQGANLCYASNGTAIELRYGINETDRDGLNETFNDSYTDTTGFTVGGITIDVADGCSLAHPYTSEALTPAWNEVLLTDNNSIIFTSLLRENGQSFKSNAETADFQMLVLENGHAGSELTTTNYFFFVELS